MTAASETDPRRARRAAARLAKLRRIAFRKARRHTWTVRSLRLLFPVAIIAMIGAYGALVYAKLGISVGAGKLKIQAIEITPDDLKMKGVTYDGVTKDGGRYDVRATEAQVDISQKGPVRLTGIDGDLKQLNGVKTNLKSTRGILDNDKGEMDLFDGVTIDTTNGLKASMQSAKVFNKENRVVAKEGVIADTGTGRIAARMMELQTKERRGVFTGDVAVKLTPDPASTKSALATGKDAREPIDVRAQKLDFDDTARVATFTGGVTAIQGDSQIASTSLRITYEGRANVPGLPGAPATPRAAIPAQPAAGAIDPATAATRLQTLKATGQVVITQAPDRRITAETLDIDVPADTAVFTGPAVEVVQGDNRLSARRIEVDRKTGKSRLSSPADGKTPVGRIRTVFIPPQKSSTAPRKVATEQPSGFMAFKTDSNAPMDIEAETLDVNDTSKQAIYRKAVRAQQGDFVITAAEVVANYSGDTGLMTVPGADAGKKAVGPQITRIEANENVVITSKDNQEARGKKAVFDAKTNILILSGGVLVKMGENAVTGTRLPLDMTTGIAEFENDGTQPSIGTAAPAALAVKSAPGPGGLPQVGGIQLPAAPTPSNTGRQSLTVFPETLKKGEKGLVRGAGNKAATPAATPTQPPAARPPADGWQPTTSPSPIYRSP